MLIQPWGSSLFVVLRIVRYSPAWEGSHRAFSESDDPQEPLSRRPLDQDTRATGATGREAKRRKASRVKQMDHSKISHLLIDTDKIHKNNTSKEFTKMLWYVETIQRCCLFGGFFKKVLGFFT